MGVDFGLRAPRRPTHGYEPTREGCDGGVREELAAGMQGAFLDGAQLQGARLNEAQLQGASLDGAQLRGASLLLAQLQGVSLDGAKLEGVLLSAMVWRARGRPNRPTVNLAENVKLDPDTMLWTTTNSTFAAWRDRVLETIPARQRNQALQRRSVLDPAAEEPRM